MYELLEDLHYDQYSGISYPEDTQALHVHAYHEMSLVNIGDITYVTDKTTKHVCGKALIFSRAHQFHNPYIASSDYQRTQITFSSKFLYQFIPNYSNALSLIKNSNIWPLTDKQYQYLQTVFADVKNALDLPTTPYTILLCASELLNLLIKASNIINKIDPYASTENDTYIKQVIEYIHANYFKKLTINAIADLFFVSRAKLLRDFKELTGITLNYFIIHTRFEHAKEFLTSGLSITETAERCGFSSASHFIASFKKHFNLTPLAYVQKMCALKNESTKEYDWKKKV